MNKKVRHGGNLNEAMDQYGGEAQAWLDLSTGISPWAYSIPDIPEAVWQNLPNLSHTLLGAAADYYQCSHDQITVTPGSQLAIRLLPTLVASNQSVAIPKIGYQEHQYAWQNAGHRVVLYESIDELSSLCLSKTVQNAVVINPNNPTGEITATNTLHSIASMISGMLLVDEAFMDLSAENSVIRDSLTTNTLVLRSVGKFFGLAGARLGFLIGQHPLNIALRRLFTPWSLNGPGQYVVELALKDRQWQTQQKRRINSQAAKVEQSIKTMISELNGSSLELVTTGLFNTVFGNKAVVENLHKQFAQKKIWTRIGDAEKNKNWIRVSLPCDQSLERFNRSIVQVRFY